MSTAPRLMRHSGLSIRPDGVSNADTHIPLADFSIPVFYNRRAPRIKRLLGVRRNFRVLSA